MHNSALRSFVSKSSACNIRTWSGKTSEDGRSRKEHGSMEASEEHEIRSTEAQKMVSRNRSTSRSEDQKMLCTKLFDSDDIQTLYSQTSDQKEVQVAGYAD